MNRWGRNAVALFASGLVACHSSMEEEVSGPPSHPATLAEIIKAYRHVVVGDEDRATSILILTASATPDCSFIVTASKVGSLEPSIRLDVDSEPVAVNTGNTPFSQSCIAALVPGAAVTKPDDAKVQAVDGTYCPELWVYRFDGKSITFAERK